MAEEIITREELVDAKVDAKDLGECVNGNETGIVTPRYGEAYPTLPKAIEKIENTGGYISAPTLAVLNAIMPSYNYQLARVDATGDEYRWNPAATPTPLWEPTGRNFLNDSKAYAENITSINLYRGNSAHNTPFNSSTFDKTTTKIDYGSTGFRYKNANLTGGVNIPFNGE
ncbi:hypothetical protein ABTE47_07050, partial [Acinetobacter baumannii]